MDLTDPDPDRCWQIALKGGQQSRGRPGAPRQQEDNVDALTPTVRDARLLSGTSCSPTVKQKGQPHPAHGLFRNNASDKELEPPQCSTEVHSMDSKKKKKS